MFWIYDISQLFTNPQLFPLETDTLDDRLNALSRLIITIWIILLMCKYTYSWEFLVIFSSFIIIHYNINRNMTPIIRENYVSTCYSTDLSIQPNTTGATVTYFDKDIYTVSQMDSSYQPDKLHELSYTSTIPLDAWKNMPKPSELRIQTSASTRVDSDETLMSFDKNFYSTNYALQNQKGPASIQTLIPPVMVAPCMASDYWGESYVVPQNINKPSTQELFLSGYIGNSTCGDISQFKITPGDHSCNVNVSLTGRGIETRENFVPSGSVQPWNQYNASYTYQPNDTPAPYNTTTELNHPSLLNNKIWINSKGTDGDIIDTGVYNPVQMLEHNIPSNFPSGQCSRENTFNEYNKNLFTNIIEPGMYSRNEVIEPISSNMGISETVQFEPVAKTVGQDGTTFTIQDPRVIRPRPPVVHDVQPNNANVYDPRSFGYGTSYRGYIDEMTGQPRFYYDDVDAVRRPNYICRSNVDSFKWADSYGTVRPDAPSTPGGSFNDMSNHRALAQNQFLESTLNQREELEQRYMRKFNSEVAWQRRIAPIRRDGRSSTSGGM